MRMKQALVLSTLTLACAAPAVAQGDWIPAKCTDPGHYLVSSAIVYMRDEKSTHFDEQKEKDLKDTYRVLTQALSQGQDKNPAVWYYLGRYYIERKDAAGMDSAFSKAETLKPACHDDIYFWRHNYWVPIFNNAVHAVNSGKSDSALYFLQQAAKVSPAEPDGLSLLGTLYFNNSQYDSAATYFNKALVLAQDPRFAKNRKDLMFNLAAAEQEQKNYDSAAAVYRAYLKLVPNDPSALSQLANTFASAGHQDSAKALYQLMLQHTEGIDPQTLFAAGVAMYNSAPPAPDTFALGSKCRDDARKVRPALTAVQIRSRCDKPNKEAMAKYDSSSAGIYALAEQAFHAGLANNSEYRDALYNLTNTYFISGQKDSMLAVSKRLYVVDPMNRKTLELVAQAYQQLGKSDSTLKYVTLADSLLPFEVNIGSFQPGDQNASLSGVFTNFHTTRTAAAKIIFEFIDAHDKVVASQTVDVAPIDPSGNQAFQAQAIGVGIVAWRYRAGP